MTGVTVVDHPLVARHLAVLRDRAHPSSDFRRRLSDVSMLLLFEALRDLRVREDQVETPLETPGGMRLADEIVVVAILRAGLGMVDGALRLIPEARVGHLGVYRDEESLQPVGYYESLPPHAADAEVVVADPMLATGGSAVTRSTASSATSPGRMRFVCLVAAPEGAGGRCRSAPRRPGLLRDDRPPLDERGYIRPGLGDAGDRIFGTEAERATPPRRVLRGRGADQRLEVADEVRLVEVAEVERRRRPVAVAALRDPLGRLVQPVALQHPLGAHADVAAEQPLQAARRHRVAGGQLVHAHDRRVVEHRRDDVGEHVELRVRLREAGAEERLPHGERLVRLRADGSGQLVRRRAEHRAQRQRRGS